MREIVLRDKAPEFLETSPKATVPVLVTKDQVIEESIDVMRWALGRNDPEGWLNMPPEGEELITHADGPFKAALDGYKYASRSGVDPVEPREIGSEFVRHLDTLLDRKPFLFGDKASLADMAILPFIRQFANVDRAWFDAQDWPSVHIWLGNFLDSPQFAAIMVKYPKWQTGDEVTIFPSH